MRTLPSWMSDAGAYLDGDSPIPIDRPFTAAQADALGVNRYQLGLLVAQGLIRRLLRSCYVATQVPDSPDVRAAAVGLIAPRGAIVVDRTAAWLHGVEILPRSAVRDTPPVQVYSSTGSRLRRPGVDSGVRSFKPGDLMNVGDLKVTTPLRTAMDLGRSLWRYDSIAALDAFVRAGVEKQQILDSVERFKGQRGVVQLRELAPLADPRPESPAESALYLYWREAPLPDPIPQFWVNDDHGRPRYRIDLAEPACRYGAEYYGEAFHGAEHAEADAERLDWLRARGWTIDVFTKEDVYALGCDPANRLARGIRQARIAQGMWVPGVVAS